MAEQTNQKSLHDRFMALPEKIREWLTSERATFTVIEINKQLGLFGGDLKIIPRLIARLVIKDLDPENFIKELAEGLGIDHGSAETVAKDIVQRILKPIDLQLKEIEVFPALIFPTKIEAAPQAPQQPAAPTAPAIPTYRPASTPPPAPSPPSIPPTIPSSSTPSSSSIPSRPPLPPAVKIPINVSQSKPSLPPIKNEGGEGLG